MYILSHFAISCPCILLTLLIYISIVNFSCIYYSALMAFSLNSFLPAIYCILCYNNVISPAVGLIKVDLIFSQVCVKYTVRAIAI